MIYYLFKSLYKNDIVVAERRKHGWWVSVILMILGVFLVVIPTLVSGLNTHGSQLITNSGNYEIDRALTLFANDEYDVEISKNNIEVLDQRLLDTYVDNGAGEPGADPIVYTQKYTSTDDDATSKDLTILKLYYYPENPLENDHAQEKYTSWLNKKVLMKNDEGTPLVAPRTFMILTKTYITLNIYNPLNKDTDMTATTIATYSGLYDSIEELTVLNNGVEKNITNLKQLKGVSDDETYQNLGRFLDNCYNSSRVRALWISLGLNLGLSFIFIIIGMICIFLFLRGKNSIYTDVSFLDSMKIAFTFAFSPGIIGLILGFFLPTGTGYGVAFMLPYAFRIIFLITKSRNNPNASSNKPVYQARS